MEATARLILAYVRVLVTGMSGVGKSTLVRELRRRGFRAYDADDDGFSEPRADGRWGWRVQRVADVLKQGEAAPDLVFFAGCSEEQVTLPFDYRVLLTAPAEILVQRLIARTTNGYGRSAEQRAQVLADLADSAQSRARDDCLNVLITVRCRLRSARGRCSAYSCGADRSSA
jgi:adenylate kinase family enzyme